MFEPYYSIAPQTQTFYAFTRAHRQTIDGQLPDILLYFISFKKKKTPKKKDVEVKWKPDHSNTAILSLFSAFVFIWYFLPSSYSLNCCCLFFFFLLFSASSFSVLCSSFLLFFCFLRFVSNSFSSSLVFFLLASWSKLNIHYLFLFSVVAVAIVALVD